jgi:DNA-binding LytR/AlgR family response regulator
MFKFLFQPYPSQKNTSHTIFMSCVAGVCIFAIFYFIKPFGLSTASNGKAAIVGAQYGLVTLLLSALCTTLVPAVFPQWFNEKHWQVWHEIVFLFLLLFVIALGNVWLTAYLYKQPFTGYLFFSMFKYTVAFGMAPVVISVLVKQQNLLHKYSSEAKQIEILLKTKSPQPTVIETSNIIEIKEEIINEPALITAAPKNFTIKGSNQTENLTLTETDFIFAEAADNYTTIHYLLQLAPKQVLYRMTIKNLEAQTTELPNFFRCHKSFMVNLMQVQHITGNAQGYKLQLKSSSHQIPVSRTLNAIIKTKIANLQAVKA